MAADNRLELVIEVDTRQGNTAVQGLNKQLGVFEKQASQAANGAATGFERMAASMAKSESIGVKLKGLGAVLDTVLKPLRMAAYLIPGLGIAGIITLLSDLLLKIIPIPDALKRIFESEAEAKRRTDELTKSIREQNDELDKYYDRLQKLREARGLIGLEGSARGAVEIQQAKSDVQRARIELEDISGQYNRLYVQAQRTRIVGGRRELTPEAEQALKVIEEVSKQKLAAEQKYEESKEALKNREIEQEYLKNQELKKAQDERLRNLKTYLDQTRALEISAIGSPAGRIGAQRQADIAAARIPIAGVGPGQVSAREAAINAKAIQDLQKIGFEYGKTIAQQNADRLVMETKLFRQRLDYEDELAGVALENARELYTYQEQQAAAQRDAALRGLEMAAPRTIEEKAALEAKRAEIEIEYINQVHRVKEAYFDLETKQLITQLNLQKQVLEAAGQDVSKIQAMISEIEAQRGQIRAEMDKQTESAVAGAKENAAVRQYQAVRGEQERMFDAFKRQAEGILDALTTRSQSVAQAIGNAFKTAILTAVKEIVTSQVAGMLMRVFGGLGMRVGGGGGYAGAGGGGGGGFGALAGMIPFMGGGGGYGGFGTPPFLPTGTGGSGGGGGGGFGGMFNFSGLKQFFGQGGGGSNLQNIIAGKGGGFSWSGLAKSNAMLMGGAMLGMYGLQRGGLSGLAMTTAGGAMIGMKYGGPMGALIGAGVGAVAGIIRLFVKGAEQKAREKIRATYGIDIKDKGVLRQIVDMAKQGFGGNIDAAIRSQQVREIIELYAQTTGQSTKGMPAKMTPVSMFQSGGSLYQQPGSQTGGGSSLPGGLPGAGFDRIGGGVASNAGPMNVTINLSPEAAQNLLTQGVLKTIGENPRSIQQAATTATKANYGRREMTSLQLSPGTLTS